jgi:hypothetical protein
VRSVVVLPTASASETMNVIIYMESVITRHIVMQSRRSSLRHRCSIRRHDRSGCRITTGMPHRLSVAVRSVPDEAYAVCHHAPCITVYSGSRPGGWQPLFDQNNAASCTPLCWPLNWNVPNRPALTLKGLLSFACGRKRHDNRSRDRGPNRRPRMQGIRRSLAQCGRRSGET